MKNNLKKTSNETSNETSKISRYILLLFQITALVACDSPTQNKIHSHNTDTNGTAKQFKLSNSNRFLEYYWNYGPIGNLKVKNHLIVFVKDSNGNPRDLEPNEALEFYSSMPSMGHPLADAGYFEKIGIGIYLNKDIVYNMSGDWKNELWITQEDGKVVEEISWEDFF